MKLPSHYYLEIAGLIIVLLATTFQLTLVTSINDISNGGQLIRIDEKLNIIWFEIYNPASSEEILSSRSKSFNNWVGVRERVEKQKKFFGGLYVIFMFIGSTLLVLGRYLEIKSRLIWGGDERSSSVVQDVKKESKELNLKQVKIRDERKEIEGKILNFLSDNEKITNNDVEKLLSVADSLPA